MQFQENKTDLEKLSDALNELQNESGRNAKEDILRRHKTTPFFQMTLHFLYDPLITTGISKKKYGDVRAIENDGDVTIKHYPQLLNYLQQNNTGKLKDVATVINFTARQPMSVQEMLKGVVTKDIPLGVSATTINKVYGKDFVFKFDCMKGEKFEKYEHKLIKDGRLVTPHTATLKLDGSRVITLIDDEGNVTFMARSGKQYEGLSELESQVKRLNIKSIVLDGELLATNEEDLSSDELFTKTQKILRTKGEKKGLEFWVYDMIPLDEFKSGKSKEPYKARRKMLESVVNGAIMLFDVQLINVLPVMYTGTDFSKIQELQTFIIQKGQEGVMLNSDNGFYVTKRTNQLLKMKKFHTVDLRCLDVLEETRGGTLGAIIVDYKGYQVKVGSGFSHEERKYYWNNPDEIIGKIVEVGYFEESKNDSGGISLRFPVFRSLRLDKNEVSYD